MLLYIPLRRFGISKKLKLPTILFAIRFHLILWDKGKVPYEVFLTKWFIVPFPCRYKTTKGVEVFLFDFVISIWICLWFFSSHYMLTVLDFAFNCDINQQTYKSLIWLELLYHGQSVLESHKTNMYFLYIQVKIYWSLPCFGFLVEMKSISKYYVH